jgi:hypothetical protein
VKHEYARHWGRHKFMSEMNILKGMAVYAHSFILTWKGDSRISKDNVLIRFSSPFHFRERKVRVFKNRQKWFDHAVRKDEPEEDHSLMFMPENRRRKIKN